MTEYPLSCIKILLNSRHTQRHSDINLSTPSMENQIVSSYIRDNGAQLVCYITTSLRVMESS